MTQNKNVRIGIGKMNKEFLMNIIDLFLLLEDDNQNSVTGIFSDKTIDKINEIREYILKELTK